MRIAAQVLPLFLLVPLTAQTPNHNEVVRFGNFDMVQGSNHPQTGYALEMPGVSYQMPRETGKVG